MYTPWSRSPPPTPYPSPASLLTHHVLHSYVHPLVPLPSPHTISLPRFPTYPSRPPQLCTPLHPAPPTPYPSPASLLTHHVLHSYVHPFVPLPQTISLLRFPTYPSHPPQLCTPLRPAPPDHIPPPLPHLPITSSTVMYTPWSRSPPPRPYPSSASLLTHHTLHSYVHPFVPLPQTISLPRFPTYPSRPPQLCTPLGPAPLPPDHIPPPLPYLPITSSTVIYTPWSRSPPPRPYPSSASLLTHHVLHSYVHPFVPLPPEHISPPRPYLPITSATVMYTPSSRSPRPYPSSASLLTHHVLHSYVHPFVPLPPEHISPPRPYLPITSATVMYTPSSRSPQTISLPRFPTYPSHPPRLCTPLGLAPPRPYPSPASLLTHHILHGYVHPLVCVAEGIPQYSSSGDIQVNPPSKFTLHQNRRQFIIVNQFTTKNTTPSVHY